MAAKLKEFVRLVKGARGKLDSIDEDEDTDSASPKSFERDILRIHTELRTLKDEISHQSKKNFKLERDLRFLDSKIALLINHKISVEELESRVLDAEFPPVLPGSLKDLKHPELYGSLFFLLQTSPEYIAKLTRLVSLKEIDGLLQTVMFTLYGNQYEDREEHLLLSMFEHVLTYEVQEATEINSLMRANTAITRMMTNYCRRGPGQEYVKSSLGDTIQSLISCDQSLETDPLKIYNEMIENEEVQRPEEANLFLQAETNPEVQRRVQAHIPLLQDSVLNILGKLKSTIDEVPFGIRWLCKATRSLVQEKFPEASTDQVNAFIGGFFFLRYVNPLIATPHTYRLVSNPPPQQARRNLTLVVKLIQKLANTSSVREGYMKPLEPFVKSHHDELMTFLSHLCEVPDFHESLQLDEYITLCRKDISIEITVSEIALIHSLLLKYQGDIISSQDDPLSELLKDLPEPTEDMQKNQNTVITLDLIKSSRDNQEMPALAPRGVSLDISDEIATTWRQCKHLLMRLFRMAPHCLQQSELEAALKVALSSPMKDVVSHADFTSEHVKTLQQLGGLKYQGRDLFEEVKASLPSQKALLQNARLELNGLRSVHETMMEHFEYLQEQLDTYKEYLTAVRAKVGEVQSSNSYIFRKPRGTYRFTHAQLEKEGVILETTGIPTQRRGAIYYILSCSAPGIYCISMYHKGEQ